MPDSILLLDELVGGKTRCGEYQRGKIQKLRPPDMCATGSGIEVCNARDFRLARCVLSGRASPPWYMCLRNGATAGKMRVLFERGDFPDHISTYEALLRQQRLHEGERDPRISKSETFLLDDVREVVGTRHEDTNPDMSLSDIGLSSLDLVRIKGRTGQRLDISLSIIAIIKNPTVRALCKAVDAHLIQIKG